MAGEDDVAKISTNGEVPSGRPPLAPHFPDHRRKRFAVKEIGPSATRFQFAKSQSQIRRGLAIKNRPQSKARVRCDDHNHTSKR